METTPPKYEPAGSKPRISIDYVIGAFLDSVERFPITMCWLMVFIVWGVVGCWSYNLFNGAPTAVQNLQPALWFLTVNGMMLTLAVYLWCEQTDSRRLCGKIQIAANLLLLADLVNMILNYNSFSDSVWVGRLAVETALAVAIIFVPALKTTSHRHRLMFSYMQSGNVILAVVIAGLMAIAVSIIYGTIMLLFGDVSGELWVSSLIIFSAGLGILVFLGSIPTYEQASKMAKDYEPVKFQMAMIKYILLPLTAIYTLILYVYGLKIIATGVMPKGEICFMVTALTAAVYLLLFLLKAIDSSTGREDRLTRLSLRFFPLAMFPLLVMMSVAIGQRIGQYGMTVPRLYVLTFNIWAYITAIYLFITRSRNTNAVAVSFAVVFLLTSIIPELNYTSQVQRYMRSAVIDALEATGVERSQLPLSHPDFEKAKDKMDEQTWADVRSKLIYLDSKDDHSQTADIVNFNIVNGYYQYDPLFDDESEMVVEAVEYDERLFSDKSGSVVIPDGYDKVQYFSKYKYNLKTRKDKTLTLDISSDFDISLKMDSIMALNDSINAPLTINIDLNADSVFAVQSIEFSIDDEPFERDGKINNMTVRGYLFTR